MRPESVRRTTIQLIVLVLTPIFTPADAYAWGEEGHRIVAAIAARELKPQAAARVKELLDGQTMADVASWADQVRNQPAYRWTDRLHYVNLPPGSEAFDFQRDCPQGLCVVGAVYRYIAVLRDPAAGHEQQSEALRFLIHFVADLHQPMHVSHAHDRGGNDVGVEFFHSPTNLHKVWDELLLRRASKPWPEYAAQLRKSITRSKRREWRRSLDPAAWAIESYRLAVSHAYAVPKDGRLEAEYYDRNLPVAEQQLTAAGIRLGTMLNAIFGDGQGLPAIPAVTTQPASVPATRPTAATSRPTTSAAGKS